MLLTALLFTVLLHNIVWYNLLLTEKYDTEKALLAIPTHGAAVNLASGTWQIFESLHAILKGISE